ncbi:hypothetical protein NQD34_015017 [Periophthalmus magnuspinnatus]|nr:hypothetical protein NQD34_015017 [Periophthalmus magnuspinnatus]
MRLVFFTILSKNQDKNNNNRQILLPGKEGSIDSIAKRLLPAKPAVQVGRGVTFSSLAPDWLFGCYDTRGRNSKSGARLQIHPYNCSSPDELHLTGAERFG